MHAVFACMQQSVRFGKVRRSSVCVIHIGRPHLVNCCHAFHQMGGVKFVINKIADFYHVLLMN